RTPTNPMATAVQRRQPTDSPRNSAAPSVTASGVACRIADALDSVVSTSAATKHTEPITSPRLRRTISRDSASRDITRLPLTSASALKISAPPQPTSASTWPIGTEAAICLISTSSSAKPAIEATISRLPRRLSITGRPSPDRGARHEFRQKKLSGSILLEKGLRLHFPVARPRVRRLRLYCRPQASIRGRPMRTTIHGARALSGLLLAAAVGSAAAQLPEWQTVTEE